MDTEAATAAAMARARKKSTAPTVRRLRGDSSDNLVKLPKPLTVFNRHSIVHVEIEIFDRAHKITNQMRN